jgi:alkylation response protein AidB-like acyl-CoA dehydrogenase
VQLRDSPEEAVFRAEVRDWLAANLTDDLRGRRGGASRFEEWGREWSRKLGEAGYAAASWPKEYGGGGAPYSHQAILLEELARAQAPGHIGVIGLGMAGPTIIVHGTEQQKARYLPKILSAEEIWCQGFSEPGAGSDLASVRTRAELRDGRYVVNGQKVWSSYAHLADWCILVTLGDPDAPRYQGLTYLLVDMHAPGVEVRPLTQITGEAEFNEIFFTDVEVPVENVVGEPGQGWQVAMTTLTHERAALGFALSGAFEVAVGKLLELARGRELDARLRDLIAASWIELQAALVGVEPAARQARARAARPGVPADGRRRLLAVGPAAEPRQHDRGRHLRDPPQHRRRASARSPQGALSLALRVHAGAGGAARGGATLAGRALPARARRR